MSRVLALTLASALVRKAECGLTRAELFAGVAATATMPVVGTEIYARIPPKWDQPLPQIADTGGKEETLILIIPGAGGPDENSRRGLPGQDGRELIAGHWLGCERLRDCGGNLRPGIPSVTYEQRSKEGKIRGL